MVSSIWQTKPPGWSPDDDDDGDDYDDDDDYDDGDDDSKRLTRPMTRMEMMIPFQFRGSGLEATNS